MIPSLGSHALKALTPQTAVTLDRSRCVRHRCKHNECSRCIEVCKPGAIVWGDQGLTLQSSRCTQCLSCLAACPTAALRSQELSLLQVLADLATHPQPVLGCRPSPRSKKHASFPCLGYLGHSELMLLFALIFRDGIQFDLTPCPNCPNNHVLEGIGSAYAFVERVLPHHRLALVKNEEDLTYQPALLTRRELFRFFRERSARSASIMVERLQTGTSRQSYGSKQLPQVRALLLKSLDTLSALEQKQLIDEAFGSVVFTPQCTACGRCVGVCPTGALDPVESDHQPPSFNARECVACGSCEAFCRNAGVRVTGKNHDAG